MPPLSLKKTIKDFETKGMFNRSNTKNKTQKSGLIVKLTKDKRVINLQLILAQS